MAHRGCTICIQILNPDLSVDQCNLPVALHSPLEVLKEQLVPISGIPLVDQVLILCDLSDPDRNNDRLLVENATLQQCGIKQDSVLTLHSIGMSSEKTQKLTEEALRKLLEQTSVDEDVHVLDTGITAAEANHSYNGIIFDVESAGAYEVSLRSVSVAGMLGRVQVFARNRAWDSGSRDPSSPAHWWAHRESLSRDGWIRVADQFCRPSWDKPIEILFQVPVILLPHEKRAIYCHSGLPDDLGIQYQSYQKGDIIAEDGIIALHPGLGHTVKLQILPIYFFG